ncbi:MAG TPA: GDSL-type esterase/lipase family protein [Allosphingosinicella sp.]|jgi:lysophospholipase L1-like esterase
MKLTRRNVIAGAASAPLLAGSVPGAAAEESWQEKWDRELARNFAMLDRYRADNERLIASKAPVDIVFLGDSITEGWRDKRPGFFTPGRIGRGISGQTTSQMVLRMMADVVDLKPRAVHIMAGTNDIAGNTGPMTQEMSRDNFRMMSAVARQNGIKVLFASIPPAAGFPWRPGLETRRPIAEMNAWLRGFARQTGATYVDYFAAMADASGGMKPGLAYDGVHPTEAGYDVMARVAEPILARVIRKRRRA